MISLNDVLLAMSNIPVDDPIAEIWGRGLQSGYKIIEYTGSLPITINANGDALIDYRIYGADGGVGEATESGEPAGYKLPMTVIDNLAPPLSQWVNGYVRSTDGAIVPTTGGNKEKASDFIEVKSNTKYVFSIEGGAFPQGTSVSWAAVGFYRDDQTFIDRYSTGKKVPYTFLTPPEIKYVRLSYRSYGELWEPRLSEFSFSIPVYIGENQLDAIGEYRDYVDFGIQKIARKIREYTFTGNETFNLFAQNAYGTCWVNLRLYTTVAYCPRYKTTLRSSHFTAINNTDANFWYEYPQLDDACNFEVEDGYDTVKIFFRSTANFSTAEECKAYFKEQYDNGTPVKIWFVMKYTVGQYESTDNGKEDPPVPLPQIPTIDGTTIIDYDGDPKPSQMYVKYKGNG